jgi:DNA topoisomerase-2
MDSNIMQNTISNNTEKKRVLKIKKQLVSDTSSVTSASSMTSLNSNETHEPTTNQKSATNIYQLMQHREHIYKKPDTYTGSCESEDYTTYILSEADDVKQIVQKTIKLTPAFYKCFDELLVNCYDHKKRMDKTIEKQPTSHFPVSQIKVSINSDDSISFYNDGDGILVEWMEEHKMYPPELIFAKLLTSTNFDDNEKREWGGRNGYGAKLANIFSKRFEIETVCHVNKKKYKQTFSDNMNNRTEPVITESKAKPYTKITWMPDYERFHMSGLSDDVKSLIKRRVTDIAGITDKITKVYLDDKLIDIKSFEKYINYYIHNNDTKVVFEESMGWQIAATCSEDDVFQQVSFVNGIHTLNGGTHVEYIADQIKTKLVTYMKQKKKLDIKPQIIKNQLRLFINATKIINPAFDSQTKETLKTPKSKFGTLYEISEKFIINLAKTEIIDKIQNQAAYKDSQLLSKTDGAKKKKIKVAKLIDADRAGTKESKDATIIFTEGDSAKALAVAGLAVVGRDFYGVYPLRGKVLNVRDAATTQVMNCSVLNDIKQILGLQNGKNYKEEFENTGEWPLRYGKIMLMTDQDHDGSHIKGLMMNIFDSMWPSLLELGIITCMVTPIIKAFKGKEENIFYTLQDYEKWRSDISNIKSWRIKYYKGLGTSTTQEAKEYFKNLKIIRYLPDEEQSVQVDTEQSNSSDDEKGDFKEEMNEDEIPINKSTISPAEDTISQQSTLSSQISAKRKNSRLDLAFNKKRADDRKDWLKKYNRNLYADYNKSDMTFGEFVDKELIHFSNADNDRSIPCMIDGLKPSQRKVVYAAFKRNLNSEIKVAQLAGYVSEHASYHHGEVSLEKTIKNMAQDFVGSNNLNLLMPIGQFGTRLQGGDDAAQSRYIFTELNKLTRVLFKKEDDVLCNYLNDDGFTIEPEYYYPILPYLLFNGSCGIGSGFSTDIPQFHPIDVANYILAKIEEKDTPALNVWYRGFKGKIIRMDNGNFLTKGTYQVIGDNTIRITELPIGMWTEAYIEFLDRVSTERGKEDTKNFVKSFKDDSTENSVNITVKIVPDIYDKFSTKMGKDGVTELENKLKLTTSISTQNMHVFDEAGKIVKFNKIGDMVENWYSLRKDIYIKRRDYQLQNLKKELDVIKYKVQFILEIIQGTLEIRNVKKAVVVQKLEEKQYPKIVTKDDTPSYDYLLTMDLYKLTEEESEELKKKKELKELEYNTLFNKSVNEIWKEDINEFKGIYVKSLQDYNNLNNSTGSVENKRKIIRKAAAK